MKYKFVADVRMKDFETFSRNDGLDFVIDIWLPVSNNASLSFIIFTYTKNIVAFVIIIKIILWQCK